MVKVEKIEDENSPSKKRIVQDENYNNISPSKKFKIEQEITQTQFKKRKSQPPKWKFLEHNGPFLSLAYTPLRGNIPFLYDKKRIKLSLKAEELATYYAKITKKEYLENETFKNNFFDDWRAVMTEEEKSVIRDLNKCNFSHFRNYFLQEKKYETRNEIKKKKRNETNKIQKQRYGYCIFDEEKQELENFKLAPGIFFGRGNHPKMGRVKRRILPEDVTINCSSDSSFPAPPAGHTWKETIHDDTGMWVAKWWDDILNVDKYTRLKYGDDQLKYKNAKKLDSEISKIRVAYEGDLYSEDPKIKERATALYLIDKFAIRTGNEKNSDEADTVGCCSLRVKHVQLHEKKNSEESVAIFDFLGKSSIRYYTELSINENVFKNLQDFQKGKEPEDHLFSHITPIELNSYLKEHMESLTAKVFRTYNASCIFEKFLKLFTDRSSFDHEKITRFHCANFVVALLLNHRKSNERETNQEFILKIKKQIFELAYSPINLDDDHPKISKLLQNLKGLVYKNKEILPSTSKINYLDPRITVSWCKKFYIRVEKVFNREERKKFKWAIDMDDADYRFSVKQENSKNRWNDLVSNTKLI